MFVIKSGSFYTAVDTESDIKLHARSEFEAAVEILDQLLAEKTFGSHEVPLLEVYSGDINGEELTLNGQLEIGNTGSGPNWGGPDSGKKTLVAERTAGERSYTLYQYN